MEKSDFDDYERRSRLYHTAFEEYDALRLTYKKFYTASDALHRRGLVLTYASTLLGGILLFVIGAVLVRNAPDWGTQLAFGISVVVAGLSFVNAVDNPHQMSNVAYNSGQTLQRAFFEFDYFVTVRLPDSDENLEELEEEYHRLLERKNMINETTPSIGNKWYHRVDEENKDWSPKPLTEVTGEDGEFEVEGPDENLSAIEKSRNLVISPFKKSIRAIGY